MIEKNVTFRPIQASDRDFLCELYASTRTEEMAQLPWSEDDKRSFLVMQFEAQHKFYTENFKNAAFQVILRDEKPIGRLYIDRRQDEIRLIDIALVPTARNQGIGGRLLKILLAEGLQSQKPVRIHVEKFNPALRLYKRLGFEELEDRGVYSLMEWKPEAK